MIKNYLKVAWRNLSKNKAHTLINIAGLSVGLACSLLILLWVQDERSVDAYHKNGDRLFKVYEREYYDNKIDGNYDTPAPMGEELKKVLPEVEYAINMQDENDNHIFRGNNKVLKVSGTFAGRDIFKMFSYPLLEGDPKTALNSPLSMAISKDMAGMFFGSPEKAIGKTLKFEDRKDFIITAVFDDLPENTSRKFEYVINWDAYLAEYPDAKDWGNSGPLTFVQLRNKADPVLAERKLTHFLDHYLHKNASYRVENGLQRFDQVYLHSHFVNGEIAGGRIEYVNLFSIVAVFVLLIACINFMNLTTARSIKRAREIGVRKVVGAVRSVLIGQFIGESLMLTAIAVTVSLVLMSLALPLFNFVTQKEMIIPFSAFSFWLKLIVITLITGLVSGSYPALFLSSFNPVKVLKGTLKLDRGAILFRKGLVVFQFVLSSILIVATVIVSQQIRFIQNRNLGYDRENLVYIPADGELRSKFDVFKTDALSMPGIMYVANISSTPTFIDSSTINVQWDGKDPGTSVAFENCGVKYDVIKTMKLQLLAGRDFSKDFPTDSAGYIINETAREKLGYANPVGKNLAMWGRKGKIIGLVKDFHFQSLHKTIMPLIIYFNRDKQAFGNILIRTKPGKTKEALASIETLCKRLNPDFPVTYNFSDDQYLKLYKSEQIIGKLSNIFASLAIFISCLGLLGLAMFTAEQRTKEIGIRKVLGASVTSLFALLSSEFLTLVIVASVIASPIAWYSMHKWLQDFAYHTPVQWWLFIAAGGVVVLIALVTVSFQAMKAALVNPVKSLRSE